MIIAAALMTLLSASPPTVLSPPPTASNTGVEFPTLRVKRTARPRFAQRKVTPPPGGGATPLVVAFDERGHADLAFSDATFELEPGRPVHSVWPRAATPWLCRDLEHDGRIGSGRELFGSFTLTTTGLARDGFAALAWLDANGDGTIDARDPAFAELRLWRDADGNRRTEPGELQTLAEAGVVSLSLHDWLEPWCVDGGCERERATVELVDVAGQPQRGALIDVHLVLRASGAKSELGDDRVAQRSSAGMSAVAQP